jgi:cellulose 1,4-beta-cellobiosidase
VPTTAVPTTPATIAPTTQPGTHLANPFAGAKWFINPAWAAEINASSVTASQKAAISQLSTAVWLDSMAAVNGTNGYPYSLTGWLDQAESQGANLISFVIYDLPNRDCAALSSNGEIAAGMANLTSIYEPQYIDPIVSAFSQTKYNNLRIIAVIEPDSLPNIVTNNGSRKCTGDFASVYETGVQYALNKLHAIPNVYNYVDIGQYGWLGWTNNLGWDVTTAPTSISATGTGVVQLIANVVKGTTAGVNSIDGFISNTSNYSPTIEPYMNAYQQIGGQPVRSYANFYQYNQFIDDSSYSAAFQTAMQALGFPASSTNMLIDTSRNGWGGCGGLIGTNTTPCRPTAVSTSTTLSTFVDATRIDRRPYGGAWCNQNGAGLGARPQANPAALTLANTGTYLPATFSYQAFVWIKPPGESDGADGTGLPTPTVPPSGTGKGYDGMCQPSYIQSGGGNPQGIGTNALSGAPTAGQWFEKQFDQLVANAYPAIP